MTEELQDNRSMQPAPAAGPGDIACKLQWVFAAATVGGILVGVEIGVGVERILYLSGVLALVGVVLAGTLSGARVGPIGWAMLIGALAGPCFAPWSIKRFSWLPLIYSAVGVALGLAAGVALELWSRRSSVASPPSTQPQDTAGIAR
jgi:hypothetical protein